MNNDLISREDIKELIYDKLDERYRWDTKLTVCEFKAIVEDIINKAPTVDLKAEFLSQRSTGKTGLPFIERPKGEWLIEYDRLKCPFCGMSIVDEVHWLYSNEYSFNFCPNCGAELQNNESAD